MFLPDRPPTLARRSDRLISSAFWAVAAAFVAAAIVGVVNGYSPVPFWDMWDGYVDFHTRLRAHDATAWWAQHNEHRIVLARLLFWIDLEAFAGRGAFLVVCNVALLASASALFVQMLHEAGGDTSPWVSGFLVAWLFSWIQHENLTWGFQSQFIFAQLVPLASFWLLHRAASDPAGGGRWFVLALTCGALSLGTMANGVLALPLMAMFSIGARMGLRRVAILSASAVAGPLLYFRGYHAPVGHGSLTRALTEMPLEMANYVATYLGGPFAHAAGLGSFGLAVGTVAGIVFMVVSVVCMWLVLRARRPDTLALALLAFIAYIGGTAFGTAGGRAVFGIAGAAASRYMTPALMAWVALVVLVWAMRRNRTTPVSHYWAVAAAIVLAPMAMLQSQALELRTDRHFERRLAALALALGIDDERQIQHVYPNSARALEVADPARRSNDTVFGMAPFRHAAESIGRPFASDGAPPSGDCLGYVDEAEAVAGDSEHVKIRGWFYSSSFQSVPASGDVVDAHGTVLGRVITGRARPDVARAVSPHAAMSGFSGYLRPSAGDLPETLVDPITRCRLRITVPAILFRIIPGREAGTLPSVDATDIIDLGAWTGSDSFRSRMPGLVVLGSFVNGDPDTGSVVIGVRGGGTVLYRAGPTVGRQTMEIVGRPDSRRILPPAADWTILEFVLPADERVDVRLSDEGDGWGEWSAVALRAH